MYNSSRSTTFILVISSSDKVIVNIIHKSTCLSYSSWNYEWYVNLWIMFTNTLSNEKVTKIKVVDSDEFNNFYVHDFSSWNNLRFQNLVWSCHLFKFKISTIQIWSNEKMIKIKLYILMSSRTLVFMSFSAEIIYSFKILFQVEIVWISNFESFKQSHMTRWPK